MYGALKNRGSILTKAWKKASLSENLESSGKFPLSRSDERVSYFLFMLSNIDYRHGVACSKF